jgi:ribosome-associated protein
MMELEALRALVHQALEDTKAVEIKELDVRGMTAVMDYMFVSSGTSNRHIKPLADHLL